MGHRCSDCGRFTKRIKDAVGLPLSTGFPPDRRNFASNIPHAPFLCLNHRFGTVFSDMTSHDFGRVEYQPVDWR